MVNSNALTAVAAAVLLAIPANGAGLYHKMSPVIQVDAKNYDRLIAKSNHTSIVEFYAPWCGHCKNLQPAWEKAARGLAGLAKVAAVNCDEDANKQFCGSMGVQGFPTLKIVKPGKKYGSPIVEDYQGPREAKNIIDAVISKIPNHVTKVTDKDLDAFLNKDKEKAKAILFTEKGTTSALLKAVAIDFLGSVQVAQIRSKEQECVDTFGITKFPTIVLLPGGEADKVVYDGEMKKDGIVQFLSQIAPPNPDPAPAKVKMPKDKSKAKEKEDKKAKEKFESASSSHASSEATEAMPTAAEETLEESIPTESPDPIVTPSAAPVVVEIPTPPIPSLDTVEDLVRKCLDTKSGTCILAFTPEVATDSGTAALSGLAEVAHKYTTSKRAIFPFYAVPASNTGVETIKSSLGLDKDIEIIAVNRKRGWWRQYDGSEYTLQAVEQWVDAIRMGEGTKNKLPDTILSEHVGTFGQEQKPLGEVPLEAGEGQPKTETETKTMEETTVTQKIEEVIPDPVTDEPAEPTEAHVVDEL